MKNAYGNALIERYFQEFEASAQTLDIHHRSAIQDELRAHLAELLPPDASDDEIADALEQLGSPAQILSGEIATNVLPNQTSVAKVLWTIVGIFGWVLVGINVVQMIVGAILNLSGSQFPPGWYWIGMLIGLVLGSGVLALSYWGRRRTRRN